MMALQRTALKAAVFFLAILLFAYISVLVVVNSAKFQNWLRAELKDRTGYELAAGQSRLDPLFRLTLSAVTVSKATQPVLQAERILVVLSPASWFAKSIYRLQLVKPTLHLDLSELFDSAGGSQLDFSFRYLNIEDGTLVLKRGHGDPIEFRALAMNAENVNVGQTTGLNLRMEVPWLDGVAEIILAGDEKEKTATIRVEQNRARGLANRLKGKSQRAAALEANGKLTKNAGEPIRVSAAGKLNGMALAAERFSGNFAVHADLTPDLKKAVIGAKLVTTELPSRSRLLPLTLPEGNATLTLEGNVGLEEKKLDIKSLRLISPLGDAAGTGFIHFAPPISLTNTRVNLRKVPFEQLKPLLPSSVQALASGGQVEADLEMEGPWRSLTVRGITRSSGIRLKGDAFSLAELNLQTPILWSGGSLRAGDIQLLGRKLAVDPKNLVEISAEEIRFDGTMEKLTDEPVKVAGGVRINQGRFTSADGSRVGENLALSGRFETTAGHDRGAISMAGKLDIEQGEMLWGKFFSDLKSLRPSFQFDCDYVQNSDVIRLRQANLALASVGTVAVKGEIERAPQTPVMRLEINSDDIQSGGAFELMRQTLNRSYPILDRLAVGGRIGFFAKATGALDAPTFEGELRLRSGAIGAKANNWQLGGIELLLPFRVRYPEAPPDGVPANLPAGTLAIESARFGAEIIPAVRVALSLRNNSLRFHQPVRLPIYGGVLEISRVFWNDLIAAPQAVSLSLDAKNLQLLKLSETLGWHRFGGTLSGSIPKIEWSGESLRSQGQIHVDLFGGRVQIGQLEIENPFSAVPSIKLDARFQDIQLEQASKTFAFGSISGILAGTVSDLVLANKQPSQFRADIHSVEKRGFSQRISVESLNKITVLSSGNDAGALYGGIAGFFDNFRYSKLGFRATLRNDKLTLRGVESRDGQEYLVVGSLIPPTVNIISHTQEIAFSELLRRLERIQESESPQKTVR
jgi:hypothetical protein